MSTRTPLKKRLAAGDVVFGPWCVIPDAHVMNITASAGFDFVIIDLEHGPASFETAESMVRAAQSEGVSALIRLGRNDEEAVLKSLDIGADGVIAAHVESGADARDVVANAKYAPLGRRGFSPYTRAGGFGGGDIQKHADAQNDLTLVGVILEGRRGIENLPEIVNTEGIDLIYIGAYDLSQSLGMPGNVRHPQIRSQMEACVGSIRDAGVAAGGFVAADAEDMAWMKAIGMQFVTYMPDCAVFHKAMSEAAAQFRALCR